MDLYEFSYYMLISVFVILIYFGITNIIEVINDIREKKKEEQKEANASKERLKLILIDILKTNQGVELFCYENQISFGMSYPQQINEKVENERVFNEKHEIALKNLEKEIDEELSFKTQREYFKAALPKIDTYRCLIMENVEKMIEYYNNNNPLKVDFILYKDAIDLYQSLKLYNEYIDKCYCRLNDCKNTYSYKNIHNAFLDMSNTYRLLWFDIMCIFK